MVQLAYWKIFNILVILSAFTQSSNMVNANTEEFANNLAAFAINIYSKLLTSRPNENIVFSPFSIQTCAAMARVGAEEQTAQELDRGLGLISNDINVMTDTFHDVLARYENSSILKIANKIYVMSGCKVEDEFNAILSKKFFSTADELNFADGGLAANTINTWVESKTNNLIKGLLSPNALDSNTSLVLLNAIHFKGEWLYKFPKERTRNGNFYLNESDKVKIPMMSLKERFRYADLRDLEAKALEMPYNDSDLSMLVILPNSRTGLKNLVTKLKTTPLSEITRKLTTQEVIVKLPKFKAEFQVSLNEPFRQLGMERMFSDNAEFGKMLQRGKRVKVSAIIHKAFIDVNEEGTEAAAAIGIEMVVMPSLPIIPKKFTANRPFIYCIKNKEGVQIFTGSVVKQ